MRRQAKLGNVCTIVAWYVRPKGSITWKSTTEIHIDKIHIQHDGKGAEPLHDYPLNKSGFFFKTSGSNLQETKKYFSPATESSMFRAGIIQSYSGIQDDVQRKIETNSLTHLFLAMFSDFRNRWSRFAVSTLIRGLVSFPIDSGKNFISHSWTRDEIAQSAIHIKHSLINGNDEHPIHKWFEPITMLSPNREIPRRYISLLGRYKSGSILFGDYKWDAMVDGFSQVCKIAEQESFGNTGDYISPKNLPFRKESAIFDNFAQDEEEASRKPVEEFVKIHDDMLELGLQEFREKDESIRLEFIEKVIRKMMEKIHQTQYLEGRNHRKEQLIERREGLIAGTVLGLRAVYPSF